MAARCGNQELVDLCTGRIGCWMITHPDKGSDVQIFDMAREWTPGQPGNKGNIWGRLQGDEIVINGQCSAWVSNGAVAQVALGYIGAEYDGGFFDSDGRPHGMAVIIPLDLPGVSKGKPLDKIGQRSLPQGEIYFDNVRVPKRFAVALKDEYYGNMASAWSYAGTHMAQTFTGVARGGVRAGAAVLPRAQAGRQAADRPPAHALPPRRHAAPGRDLPLGGQALAGLRPPVAADAIPTSRRRARSRSRRKR